MYVMHSSAIQQFVSGHNPRIVLLFLHTRIVLGGKKPPHVILEKQRQKCFFNGKPGICDCGEFKDSVRGWFRLSTTTDSRK